MDSKKTTKALLAALAVTSLFTTVNQTYAADQSQDKAKDTKADATATNTATPDSLYNMVALLDSGKGKAATAPATTAANVQADDTTTTPADTQPQTSIQTNKGFYVANGKGTHNSLTGEGLWVGGTDDNTGFHVDNDGNATTTGTLTASNGKFQVDANGAISTTDIALPPYKGHNSTFVGSGLVNGVVYDTTSDSPWAENGSEATGSVAIARGSNVRGTNGLAVGTGASVGNTSTTVTNGTALGSATNVLGQNGTAVGEEANVNGDDGTALGYKTKAEKDSTAIGSGATAGYNNAGEAVAIGKNANVQYKQGVAIGNKTEVLAEQGTALGYNAKVSWNGKNSVAIGANSFANDENVVSVGRAAGEGGNISNPAITRRIINVADGTIADGSHDAVTGGQLYKTNQVVKYNYNYISNLDKAGIEGGTITAPHQYSDNNIAIGNGAEITANETDGYAKNNTVLGNDAEVLPGFEKDANGNVVRSHNVVGSTAIGGEASVSGTGSSAIGAEADAAYDDSTAVGYKASATEKSTAVGSQSQANSNNATSLGYYAKANAVNGVAIGSNTNLGYGTDGSVALGANSTVTSSDLLKDKDGNILDKNGVVSVGSTGSFQRRIVNVADGKEATDAATYGQLTDETNARTAADKALSDKFTAYESTGVIGGVTAGKDGIALGKDSGAGANATVVGSGASAVTGATAFGKGASASGENSAAIGTNAVVTGTGKNSVALGIDSYVDEENTVSVGGRGLTRKITNVADGVADTDAATVGQVNKADKALNDKFTAYESTGIIGGVTAGKDGIALGKDSGAGANATVVGSGASAVTGATAFGKGASASGENSAALGTNAVVTGTGKNAVALGSGSYADEENTVSVGGRGVTRKITNVTDGTIADGSHDAVTGGQLYKTNQVVKYNYNYISTLDKAGIEGGTITYGPDSYSSNNLALGSGSQITADETDGYAKNNTVIGTNAQILPGWETDENGELVRSHNIVGSTAIGGEAKVNGNNSSAFGAEADAAYNDSTAVGYKASSVEKSTAVGSQAQANGTGATALGYGATAGVNNGVAIGANANAGSWGTDGSIALGANSTVTQEDLLKDKDGNVTETNGVVSVGDSNYGTNNPNYSFQRRIINVADGVNKYDAVNKGQLDAVADSSVQYDKNEDDTINAGSVTFKGDNGTALKNVNDISFKVQRTYTDDEGNPQHYYEDVNFSDAGLVPGRVTAGKAAQSVNIGGNAVVAGTDTVVIGGNSADKDIGYYNNINADRAVVIGQNINATNNSVAVGYGTDASGDSSVALGKGAKTTIAQTVALGAGSVADEYNTVSVGSKDNQRKITNVADGVNKHDAVNKGQLDAVDSKVGTLDANAVKYDTADKSTISFQGKSGTTLKNVNDIVMNVKDAYYDKTYANSFDKAGLVPGRTDSSYSTAIGHQMFGNKNVGKNSSMGVAIGDNATIGDNAERSTALGYNSKIDAGAKQSVALGSSSHVYQKDSIAVGESAEVRTQNGIAIGQKATIQKGAVNSVAIGGLYAYDEEGGLGGGGNELVAANAKNSTVVGAATLSQSVGGTALGKGARVGQNSDNSLALGVDATVQMKTKNAVALGANSVADEENTVSVGSKGNERKITNVADGFNAHDAVNKGQLDAVNTKVGTLDANAVQYDKNADGTTDYNSITLKGKKFQGTTLKNVGDIELAGKTTYGQDISFAKSGITPGYGSDLSKDGIVSLRGNATDTDAIAVGTNAFASKLSSIAIGARATSQSEYGVALGEGTWIDAVDQDAKVKGDIGSVALGAGSSVTNEDTKNGTEGVVSVGSGDKDSRYGAYRRIINVADGVNDHDAVNKKQLDAVETKTNTLDNLAVKYTDDSKSAINVNGATLQNVGDVELKVKGGSRGLIGSGITPGKVYAKTGGSESNAADTGSLAIGGGMQGSMTSSASTRGKDSVAIGAGATVDTQNAKVDPGYDAFDNAQGVAVGVGANVSGIQGTAVGYGAKATGNQSTTYGNQSNAQGNKASAFGFSAVATANNSTAIGQGASVGAGADNSIALGTGSTVFNSDLKSSDKNGVVSVGTGNGERRIIHVADGIDAHDAVNKGQLDAIDTKVGTLNANAVKYDSDAKDSITFAGTNGTALNNVDSVNGLKISNFEDAYTSLSTTAADATGNIKIYGDGGLMTDGTIRSNGDVIARVNGEDKYSLTTVGKYADDLQAAGVVAGTVDDGDFNLVLGENASVTGGNSNTVIGNQANVNGAYNVAIGTGANVKNDAAEDGSASDSVAIGYYASATANNSVALGDSSVADEDNTVSIGTTDSRRRLVNASGVNGLNISDSDGAYTVIADKNSTGKNIKIYNDGGLIADNTIKSRGDVVTLKEGSNDELYSLNKIGTYTDALQSAGFTAGTAKEFTGKFTAYENAGIKTGTVNTNGYNTTSNIALGQGASITFSKGYGFDENGNLIQRGVGPWNAIAIGADSQITDSANAIVIGGGTNGGTSKIINSKSGIVVGSHNTIDNSGNGVVIGSNSSLHNAANSVALGGQSIATEAGVVSVGRQKGDPDSDGDAAGSTITRRIINVAAGKNDNDATIVGQFKGANGSNFLNVVGKFDWKYAETHADKLNQFAAAVVDGKFDSLMNSKTFQTFSNLDVAKISALSLAADVPTSILKDTTTTDATQQRDPDAQSMTTGWYSTATGTKTDGSAEVGKDLTVGGNTTLNGNLDVSGTTTLKDTTVTGSLTIKDGDKSLNVGDSIKANQAAIEQNQKDIFSLGSSVAKLGDEVDSVGAISAALAGLHPLDYSGSASKFQISAALGTYDGTQAAALGGFYNANRNTLLSFGVSTNLNGGDRKTAANIGATFRVGAGNSEPIPSDVDSLRSEVVSLKAENASYKDRMDEMEKQIQELMKANKK